MIEVPTSLVMQRAARAALFLGVAVAAVGCNKPASTVPGVTPVALSTQTDTAQMPVAPISDRDTGGGRIVVVPPSADGGLAGQEVLPAATRYGMPPLLGELV